MTIIVQTTASASSRDYDWLKASIAKWSHRTNLTDVIPDFVMMAEKRINDDLEARPQEELATINTEAGIQSAAIPDDVAEVRALSRSDYGPLGYLPPDRFALAYPTAEGGAPQSYTTVGSSFLFGPIPDSAYSLQAYVRLRVPALADSAGTNWLITKRPDIYLAASMVEAMIYMKDLPGQQQWEAKYSIAMSSLNMAEWGTNGPMTIRAK